MIEVTCAHIDRDVVNIVNIDEWDYYYCSNCGAMAEGNEPWVMPALLKNLHVEQETVGND